MQQLQKYRTFGGKIAVFTSDRCNFCLLLINGIIRIYSILQISLILVISFLIYLILLRGLFLCCTLYTTAVLNYFLTKLNDDCWQVVNTHVLCHRVV